MSKYRRVTTCTECGRPLGYSVALDTFVHLDGGCPGHTPAPRTSLPLVDDADLAAHLAAFHGCDISARTSTRTAARQHRGAHRRGVVPRQHTHERRGSR